MLRKIKFFWQRLTRGFDDSETWSLDYTFFKWLLPRLKRFREVVNGYPSEITYDEWMKELDQAIADLEIIKDDAGFGKEHDEAYARFVKWFTHRLGHLWW